MIHLTFLTIHIRIDDRYILQTISLQVFHKLLIPSGAGGDDGERSDATRLTRVIEEKVEVRAEILIRCWSELIVLVFHAVTPTITDGRTLTTPVSIGDIALCQLHGKTKIAKQTRKELLIALILRLYDFHRHRISKQRGVDRRHTISHSLFLDSLILRYVTLLLDRRHTSRQHQDQAHNNSFLIHIGNTFNIDGAKVQKNVHNVLISVLKTC